MCILKRSSQNDTRSDGFFTCTHSNISEFLSLFPGRVVAVVSVVAVVVSVVAVAAVVVVVVLLAARCNL